MTVFPHHQRHCELGDRVLAAWFDNPPFRAAWTPEPDLFFLPAQREIARIAASVGPELDVDQLLLTLDRSGSCAKLFPGGAEDVLRIVRAPFELDPWARLEELREVAARRRLLDALEREAAALRGDDTVTEVRGRIIEAVRASDARSKAAVHTVRGLALQAYEQVTSGRTVAGQRTISAKLDELTGGIMRGDVWCVAAGTSWGKSSFGIACSVRALGDGGRPLIVTFEDPPAKYGRRVLQLRTGVNALRLRDARLLDSEHRYLAEAVDQAEDVPVLLDARGRPAEAVAADIRSMVRSEGITLVVVDYVQAMRARQQQENRRLDVYHCWRLVSEAIKESDAAGMVLSQLTEDEKSGKLRARDCEDVHNAAEVLLFGRLEKATQLDAQGKKIGETTSRWLWVEKAKDGPAKVRVELEWDANSACFRSDYDDPRAARGLFESEYN